MIDEGGLHKGRGTDPGIQIDGGATGYQPVVAGIDEIRASLEGCHPMTAPGEGSQQGQGDGGLTGTALGAAMINAFI